MGYVMDNRTGSIHAAIPANYAHSANVNVNGMHNVYAHNQHRNGHHTATQYVSIPNVAQHHVIQNANGQSAVVSMLPQQSTQQQQPQQSGDQSGDKKNKK